MKQSHRALHDGIARANRMADEAIAAARARQASRSGTFARHDAARGRRYQFGISSDGRVQFVFREHPERSHGRWPDLLALRKSASHACARRSPSLATSFAIIGEQKSPRPVDQAGGTMLPRVWVTFGSDPILAHETQ